jgi:hypothetical protein
MNPLDITPGRTAGADSPDLARLAPSPSPSPSERDIAWDSIDLAGARWLEARARLEDVRDAGGRADPTNKWQLLAGLDVMNAQQALILNILAWDPSFKDWDVSSAVKRYLPSRGVIMNGSLYLVAPDPDRGECEGESEVDVMKLIVVPMGSIVDLEQG